MEETALAYQMKKALITDDSFNYYMARLGEFPEDEWFAPTNSVEADPRGNSFSIFDHLYQINLVEKRVAPIWRNGSFCGQRIQFRFNRDLKIKP